MAQARAIGFQVRQHPAIRRLREDITDDPVMERLRARYPQLEPLTVYWLFGVPTPNDMFGFDPDDELALYVRTRSNEAVEAFLDRRDQAFEAALRAAIAHLGLEEVRYDEPQKARRLDLDSDGQGEAEAEDDDDAESVSDDYLSPSDSDSSESLAWSAPPDDPADELSQSDDTLWSEPGEDDDESLGQSESDDE
jgi:hypothetical protein